MSVPNTLRSIRRDVRHQVNTRGSVMLATWDAEKLLAAASRRPARIRAKPSPRP